MGRGVRCGLAAAIAVLTWAPAASAGVLERAERALRGDGGDATTALLAVQRAALTPDERARAAELTGRPSYDVPEQPPLCGPRVCVHWVASTDDAPPPADSDGDGVPDQVEGNLAAWEEALDFFASPAAGAWPPIKGDGDELDVYLKQAGGRGYVSTDDPDRSTNSVSAFSVVDDDNAEWGQRPAVPLIRGTAVHELAHVHQFSHNWRQHAWLYEATATPYEEPFSERDAWAYYTGLWGSRPDLPIDHADKHYGTGGMMLWLARRHGFALLRDVWTDHPEFGSTYAALEQEIPDGLNEGFSAFATESAEWRRPAMDLPDLGQLWDARRAARLTPEAPAASTALDHLSFALYDVAIPDQAGPLELEAALPEGVTGSVALVGRTGGPTDGEATIRRVQVAEGGRAIAVLEQPRSFTRITAVVTNADVRRYDTYAFTADGSPVTVRVRYPSAPVVQQSSSTSSTTTVAPPQTSAAAPAPPVVTSAPAPPFALRVRAAARVRRAVLARPGLRLALAPNRRARVTVELRAGSRVLRRVVLSSVRAERVLRLRTRARRLPRRLTVRIAAVSATGERARVTRALRVAP